jgi:predicted nucleic acid-binding protein
LEELKADQQPIRAPGLLFWKAAKVKMRSSSTRRWRLEDRQVLMVPVVLTELLSDPKLPSEVAKTLSDVPMIEIEPGYWQRAGVLRAKVIAKQRKARLGDALIAQTCIDGNISLLTRDRDFRAFGDAAGLDLVLGIR